MTKTRLPDPISKNCRLRVLHTSDWHIGKRLYQQQRYDEFAQFLSWLLDVIETQLVDILVVAGDIFDTMTPSNKAQELYYDFLGKVAKSRCQHVIITAGNHDSPTFLDAPKIVLRSLDVQVIGTATDDILDEVMVLEHDGEPQAIMLAVPYLRDRDVRLGGSFENIEQKQYDTLQGIAHHYATLSTHAKTLQQQIFAKTQRHIPIIATGHLFVAGASASSKDDGMRDLYVGTLGQVSSEIFDECIDYVALGHIHAAQKVAGKAHIRYCGSPIAMGFGEVGKQKEVLLVDFNEHLMDVHSLTIPTFQSLKRIQGDWTHIQEQLDVLRTLSHSTWVEIIYTGEQLRPNLVQEIREQLQDSQILPLSISNKTLYQQSLSQTGLNEQHDLNTLTPMQVFHQLLQRQEISDDEIDALSCAYQHIITTLHEADQQAE